MPITPKSGNAAPCTFNIRRRQKPLFSMQEKDAARFTINNFWLPYLTTGEWDLLNFVRDSTIEWGIEGLDATWSQLEAGIPGTGMWSWKRPPISISRATYYRLQKQLLERQIIRVQSFHRRHTITTINRDWRPSAGIPSMTEVMGMALEFPELNIYSDSFWAALHEKRQNNRQDETQ